MSFQKHQNHQNHRIFIQQLRLINMKNLINQKKRCNELNRHKKHTIKRQKGKSSILYRIKGQNNLFLQFFQVKEVNHVII